MKITDLKDYTVVSSSGVESSTQKTEPKDNRDFLQKTGDIVNSIFPGKKVGQSIGTLGGYLTSKFKSTYDTSAPSPFQVAGDIGTGILTVAGAKGIGGSGTLTKKLGTQAAVGAGLGGTQAISEGGDIKNVGGSTLAGAGIGAIAGGVGLTAERVVKGMGDIPERLIRSATGQSKKELLAGKDVSKYILENKRIGTAKSILAESQRMMTKANEIISKNLSSVPITQGKITNKSIISRITESINNEGGAISDKEVKDILFRLAPQSKGLLTKPSMSLVTANKLRQSIDKTVGDKGFLMSELPFNKDILRNFSNVLREEVKTKAPEGTRAAFNTLSKEITLTKALENKLSQGSRNQIISFSDLFGAIPGGIIGGVPGALAGAAGKRVVQSTPFLTGTAVGIDSFTKKIAPALEELEPGIRTLVVKAITDAVSSESQE